MPIYVGKTKNIERRERAYKSHVHNQWLRRIMQKHPEAIELGVLEVCSEDELNAAERRWIATLRAEGHRLVNQTDGGDGVNGEVATKENLKRVANGSHPFLGRGLYERRQQEGSWHHPERSERHRSYITTRNPSYDAEATRKKRMTWQRKRIRRKTLAMWASLK
jgi:hypothetical protein